MTGHSSSSIRQPLSSKSESCAEMSSEEITAPFGPPLALAVGSGSGLGIRRSTSPSANSGTACWRRRSASVVGAGAGAVAGGAGLGASVAVGASLAVFTSMLQRTDHVTPSLRSSGKPEIGQCSLSIVQPPKSRLDISAYASFSGSSANPISFARSSGLISEPIAPSAARVGSIHC